MFFFILALLAFLIVLVFRTYKTITSVIVTILLAVLATTAVLAAGLYNLNGSHTLIFFNSTIGRSDFYHLMAAWYAADLLCSALIIRNHIAYRKVNFPGQK